MDTDTAPDILPIPDLANAPIVRGPGRPRKPIDWDKVRHYAALGLPQTQIAATQGVSHNILAARAAELGINFGDLYAEERAVANGNLLELAEDMSQRWGPLVIFRLKNQLGWQDSVAVTGPGGGPLVLGVAWDPTGTPQVQVEDTPKALPAATDSVLPAGDDVADSVVRQAHDERS